MATIRAATPDDLAEIKRIARAAYSLYVERIGREPAPMVADFAASIAAEELDVLTHAGEVHGFVVFYPRDDHVHLENVAVDPAAQGLGYGQLLVQHVETAARERGHTRIELYTNIKMTENIPYYTKRGYQEIGRWNEDGFDRVFFRKDL